MGEWWGGVGGLFSINFLKRRIPHVIEPFFLVFKRLSTKEGGGRWESGGQGWEVNAPVV